VEVVSRHRRDCHPDTRAQHKVGLFLFMPYYVYILYSPKLNKYYVGFTVEVSHRLEQHNSGISTFTSRGIPWDLVHTFETETIEEAKVLEKSIKGRGIKRYLADKSIL
jgi:putative endonuclease